MADDDLADMNPLGPLFDAPVPALAPPSAVRGRGEQRRRRQRAVVSVAGVLLVGALAGGVALVGTGGDDAGENLIVPPTVTASATPTESATPPPVTTPPTAPPTSSPSVDALRIPAEALIVAKDLGPENWIRRASSRTAAEEGSPVDPCGTEQKISTAGRLEILTGSYIIEDKELPGEAVPESGGVYQVVARFGSETEAKAAYDLLAQSVQRCPSRTLGISRSEPTILSATPLIVANYSVDPPYPWPIYYGANVVGNLVAVWDFNPGETVDDAGARTVSDLVRTALCTASDTC